MTPCTWNFGPNWPCYFENADFQSIFAGSASAIRPSEKSSIITNRKSTTSFSMSLRWTAFVTLKGAQKRKTAVFRLKFHFSRRKSATKFICVKAVGDKVVRHLFAYLSVQKSLVEIYVEIMPKLGHPLRKRRLQSIFSRSDSAVTPSEKSSINTNRKSTWAFQWA